MEEQEREVAAELDDGIKKWIQKDCGEYGRGQWVKKSQTMGRKQTSQQPLELFGG